MTASFDFRPGVGALPISFGMTVAEVRGVIQSSPRSFKRNFLSKHPLDRFDTLGLFVNYNENGIVEALEFDETGSLASGGRSLCGLSYVEAENTIRSLGGSPSSTDDTVEDTGLGISFYFPDHSDEPEKPAQSVLIAPPSYFDE
ncbi:hypothetical protein HK107_00370 [Parvularcula sp. ZS-1/3]|uniref:Uncharacterized protein n=1 Tax=Parvularcula mediterranea TaxID=2732508 RepID=A0A7Y3RJG0_9PROT|nr:hypothetical protein [Parvularcula mediterranea]NNU14775.1 hypothetical protein [Parvularcula mediterranea]